MTLTIHHANLVALPVNEEREGKKKLIKYLYLRLGQYFKLEIHIFSETRLKLSILFHSALLYYFNCLGY
jgi:hypothetical protein